MEFLAFRLSWFYGRNGRPRLETHPCQVPGYLSPNTVGQLEDMACCAGPWTFTCDVWGVVALLTGGATVYQFPVYALALSCPVSTNLWGVLDALPVSP
jgi:hypothetical protein